MAAIVDLRPSFYFSTSECLGFSCFTLHQFAVQHLLHPLLVFRLFLPVTDSDKLTKAHETKKTKDFACSNSQGLESKYPDVSVGLVVVWSGFCFRQTARVGTRVPEEAEAPVAVLPGPWAAVSAFRVPWITSFLE